MLQVCTQINPNPKQQLEFPFLFTDFILKSQMYQPVTAFREDPSPKDQNFHRCYTLLKIISSKVTKRCLHKMCSELQAKSAQRGESVFLVEKVSIWQLWNCISEFAALIIQFLWQELRIFIISMATVSRSKASYIWFIMLA